LARLRLTELETIPVKEQVKSGLRKLGLYKPAAHAYGISLAFAAKAKDALQFLISPVQNFGYKRQGPPDGLPLPPIRLVHLVTNAYRYDHFYQSGIVGAQCIRSILAKNHFEIDAFRNILDFGCGCGRMMRQWKNMNGPQLFGTDYNPVLVAWCQKNLPFAEFSVNRFSARLEYRDGYFDFIYAISVFTHLTEEGGLRWIAELGRVLKPGGVLYLTVMGPMRAHYLPKGLRDRFEAGRLVVVAEESAGQNPCAAFHPEQYVRNTLAMGWRVLDYVPGGALDASQDAYLLQKL
jgi:SAM-dependent methyltransferase